MIPAPFGQWWYSFIDCCRNIALKTQEGELVSCVTIKLCTAPIRTCLPMAPSPFRQRWSSFLKCFRDIDSRRQEGEPFLCETVHQAQILKQPRWPFSRKMLSSHLAQLMQLVLTASVSSTEDINHPPNTVTKTLDRKAVQSQGRYVQNHTLALEATKTDISGGVHPWHHAA